MSNKYITLESGVQSLKTAVTTSSANEIPSLDGSGKLSIDMMPAGLGPDVKSLTNTESTTVDAGKLVNITATGFQLASAGSNRAADGFVLASVDAAAAGMVYLDGIITGLTGLTAGLRYYLGAAGAITATPNTASGETHQYVGKALSATELAFEATDAIKL